MSGLDWFRRSFLRKLLALFLVVGVLIGTVGGAIYFQTAAALADDTEGDLTKSAEIQASTIAEWSDRSLDHAAELANDSAVQRGDGVEAVLAAETAQLSDSVAGIHYVDAETGTVLNSSLDGAAGDSYAAVRWMALDGRLPEDGEATATTTYVDPTLETESVAFVAAVPGRDRLIVLPANLTERSTELDRPVDSESAFSVAVNSDGFVVLSQKGDQLNTQNMGDPDELNVTSMAVMQGLDGKSGYMEMSMNGGNMAMGFAPIAGTDWVLMTHVPTNDAFALQEFVQLAVAILLLVSFLGLGTVGAVVGRNTTRSLRDLATSAEEVKQGNLDAEPTTDRVDEFGTLYDSFDEMRRSLKESLAEADAARQDAQARAREAEQARAEAADAKEQAEEFNRHLEEKAEAYRRQIEAAAAGDLTRRVQTDSQSQAMTEIGDAFNEMVADLEETVTEIQQFADDVAAASAEATSATAEIQQSSETVSESIQQIATEADKQRENLGTVSTEMTQLSATIEEAASTANTVSDRSRETAQIAGDGEATAEQSIDEMESVQETMAGAVENVQRLDEVMAEIGEIVTLIGDIAEQTNMLALNANIEAARAGTGNSGDGFAVVADEVKQLAEETQAAAEDVTDLITDVQTTTETTVAEIQAADQQVQETTESVGQTVETFTTVVENVEATNSGVQEISDAMDDQAASAEEVVSMFDEVEQQSKAATDEAENVSAAAEQQASSTSQISENVSNLAAQADQLRTLLATFETDAETSQTETLQPAE